MPRFVVLEHRWGGVHWDLMLEDGPALRTWSLDAPPGLDAPILARERPPHRPLYLDHEGPVGGDRGHVRRVAAGDLRGRPAGPTPRSSPR